MDKKRLTKLVTYFILGDGGVYFTGCKNAKFIMNMSANNEDYIDWVVETLGNITTTHKNIRKDYSTDGYNRTPQFRVESNTHPFFTVLRDRIYIDKYKGIDPHSLKLLDWEAMAILYMCDGNLYEDKPGKRGLVNSSWNLTLNMKRLTYGDQFVLKKAIKERLGVEFNINRQKKYYCLRLRSKDIINFCNGVAPYILNSFRYKIRTIDSLVDGDIVCTSQECEEPDRNDQVTFTV